MKKTKLGDLIKLMLLEQVADGGRGGRIVEEIQIFSDANATLIANVNSRLSGI